MAIFVAMKMIVFTGNLIRPGLRRMLVMKGEINRDFYCVTGHKQERSGEYSDCDGFKTGVCFTQGCGFMKHKWPTPEQFREEYGEEYPDDGAVYYIGSDDPRDRWQLDYYDNAIDDERYVIVCACAPWGCPPADWRPCNHRGRRQHDD